MPWHSVHHSHRPELFRSAVLAGLSLLCAFFIAFLKPESGSLVPRQAYSILHAGMEMVTISISFMIFTVSWQTQGAKGSKAVKWAGALFLLVAILDLAHLLVDQSMLTVALQSSLITTYQQEVSEDFRVAARLFAGAGLLGLAMLPASQRKGSPWIVYLGAILLLALIVFFLILVRPDWDSIGIEAEDRQSIVSGVEIITLTVYLLAGMHFLSGTRTDRRYNYSALALAALLTLISEVFFITNNQQYNDFALAAHLYKLLAYLVLFRVLFLETVERPWTLLHRSENRLHATLNALPDVLFELDAEGRVIDIRADRKAGVFASLDLFLNQHFEEVLPASAAKILAQGMQEARNRNIARGYVVDLDTLNGQRYFSLSISYMTTAHHKEGRFLVLARDINDSIQHQRQLQHEARFNEVLLELARDVSSQTELAILDFAVDQARYLTESQQACLCLIDHNGEIGSHFVSGDVQTMPEAIIQSAISCGEPVMMNDKGEDETSPEVTQSISRYICMPVVESDETRLLICVFNKKERYQQRDLATLEIFGGSVWQSLRRKRQESTIEKLSLALEQSPNSVMISGLDGSVEYVNDAFVRNSGFSREETIGGQPNIVKSDKNPRQVYDQMWKMLLEGKPWQGELINRRKDGTEVPERVLIYPLRDKFGNVINYISHKEDMTELRAADERIQQLTHYDQLTQLPNRDYLEQQFNHALRVAREYQESIAVFCLNLDNFRAVNDALGQGAGDEVLRMVASRLRLALAVRDVVTRQSADTFMIMLPGMGRDRAATVASGLLNVLESPLWVHDKELNMTASVGISLYPGDGESLETLLMRAEAAMFEVKASGRNSLRFFEPKMQSQTSRVLEISNHLKHAIDHDELTLVFQPQYSLSKRCVVGAEALLRWHDPVLGQVSPGEFIPVAESNGFIIPISDWVVKTASQQLKQWRAQGMSDLVLAINLSAVQFRQSDLALHLSKIVSDQGVEPGTIEFELTEAVALQDPLLASTTMQKLTERGFHLSIDDFGTGYSSMNYLKRFAVEKLKIDQSFIRDLEQSESDKAIVKAIIEMAHSLSIRTIAEGVETEQQMKTLQQFGCDEIQGYLYSKPLPADDFMAFVDDSKVLD